MLSHSAPNLVIILRWKTFSIEGNVVCRRYFSCVSHSLQGNQHILKSSDWVNKKSPFCFNTWNQITWQQYYELFLNNNNRCKYDITIQYNQSRQYVTMRVTEHWGINCLQNTFFLYKILGTEKSGYRKNFKDWLKIR